MNEPRNNGINKNLILRFIQGNLNYNDFYYCGDGKFELHEGNIMKTSLDSTIRFLILP